MHLVGDGFIALKRTKKIAILSLVFHRIPTQSCPFLGLAWFGECGGEQIRAPKALMYRSDFKMRFITVSVGTTGLSAPEPAWRGKPVSCACCRSLGLSSGSLLPLASTSHPQQKHILVPWLHAELNQGHPGPASISRCQASPGPCNPFAIGFCLTVSNWVWVCGPPHLKTCMILF